MELLSKPVSLSCVCACMWLDVSYKMFFYLAVEDVDPPWNKKITIKNKTL